MSDRALNLSSRRTLRAGIAAILAASALLWAAAAPPAQAAPAECAGTFRVLHNDRIGQLSLPKGQYTITVKNAARLSCAAASKLFTRFLEDFDGVLPSPWILTVRTATFTRGKGSPVAFSVKRGTGGGGGNPGGGGRHPQNGGLRCPATFRVLNNDRIGALSLPKGPYYITLTTNKNLTCDNASKQFARFLQDFDGTLPSPWRLNVGTATFTRGRAGAAGFRVKPAF